VIDICTAINCYTLLCNAVCELTCASRMQLLTEYAVLRTCLTNCALYRELQMERLAMARMGFLDKAKEVSVI
jgi:hypothetical protein